MWQETIHGFMATGSGDGEPSNGPRVLQFASGPRDRWRMGKGKAPWAESALSLKARQDSGVSQERMRRELQGIELQPTEVSRYAASGG